MYYTYILENPKGKIYIGYTGNINHRLMQHNTGGITFTRNKGPWTMVYTKEFDLKADAEKYEKYLKSLKNSKYIKAKIINVSQ